MEAQIIRDRHVWNEFVASSNGCNITQSYEWGELMASQGTKPLYIGVIDDAGQIQAAMLIIVTRMALLRSPYFYAPRGPIINNDDPDSPAMSVLLRFVKSEAQKYKAVMLKIEPGILDGNETWLQALHRYGFRINPVARHLRHEWVLDIRPDEDTLMAGMRKTWRYGIRLAIRKGVVVRESQGNDDIEIFYRLLQTTHERNGGFHVYNADFYKRVMNLYGDRAKLLLAESEGKVLAGALLVTLGHWCWYMYGASSNEHREVMPNHLLQWQAFQWAKEQGCHYYNFRGIPDVLEETEDMWGIYLFKSGFGGFAMRSLVTHDLVYNPIQYQLYRRLLDILTWRNEQVKKKRVAEQQTEKHGVTKEKEKQGTISR